LADTHALYIGLIVLVVIQRLVELRLSNRHVRLALLRGGVERGAATYPVMVLLHAAMLAGAPAEVVWLDRPWLPVLGGPMLAAFVAAQALRYWAIRSLGERWMTRVVWVRGDDLVVTGPYRWLRHPNYLAVVVEFAALPLVHSAWITALAASLANVLVLRQRIAIEDGAIRPRPSASGRIGGRP